MNALTILDTMDRAHSGPLCSTKEWDMKVIPQKTMEKLKKYGLLKTCDTKQAINTDDELADTFYKAAFELAVETGLLCVDTERVIKVTEEELAVSVGQLPAEITMGVGVDQRTIRARRPEDPIPPTVASPLSLQTSEEFRVPVMAGLYKSKLIDVSQSLSCDTVYGRPLLGGTPWETMAGALELRDRREALRRAGREGMPMIGINSSTTEYGHLGGFALSLKDGRPLDMALPLVPAELKTTYAALHKTVLTLNMGAYNKPAAMSMVYGYAGPPEGTALVAIASNLLIAVTHQGHIQGGACFDLRYSGDTGREALWATSMWLQGLARNTHQLIEGSCNEVAGPNTEMILYETAVSCLIQGASGLTYITGPRSAGGRYKDYFTPLEAWFMAEVFKASAGMTRQKASEVANQLLPKYEDKLWDPPKGQKFVECFDPVRLVPKPDWQEKYLRVKRELIELGVPLRME